MRSLVELGGREVRHHVVIVWNQIVDTILLVFNAALALEGNLIVPIYLNGVLLVGLDVAHTVVELRVVLRPRVQALSSNGWKTMITVLLAIQPARFPGVVPGISTDNSKGR